MDPKHLAVYLVLTLVVCAEAQSNTYGRPRLCPTTKTECGVHCCNKEVQWCNTNLTFHVCMTKCTGCSAGDRCCSFFETTSCCTSNQVCLYGTCHAVGQARSPDQGGSYPIHGGERPDTTKIPKATKTPTTMEQTLLDRHKQFHVPDFHDPNLDSDENTHDESKSSRSWHHTYFGAFGGVGSVGGVVLCFVCVCARSRRYNSWISNRSTDRSRPGVVNPDLVNGSGARGRTGVANGRAPVHRGRSNAVPVSHVTSGNQLSMVNEQGSPGAVAAGDQAAPPLGPPPPYSEFTVESDMEKLCADA